MTTDMAVVVFPTPERRTPERPAIPETRNRVWAPSTTSDAAGRSKP